ncbi:MAG: hypothetical protein IKJ73_09020 [Lachnospiraceae bacterium]|nr:hypothetical protein [Lachnospiraceae bacterium]
MSDIKSYCGSDFGAYVRYIEEVREMSTKIKAPYIDPDKTYGDAQSKYYIELTKFLNKQEEKYIDEEKRWKYIFENNKDEPDGIKVKKNGETRMVLKSDQLGFSAIHEGTVGKMGYLYYRYLCIAKDVDVNWLAKCIWSTRTIGGGFIWPINKMGQERTKYNTTRGIGSYIEDRVDLTLLEIKHYYDWIKNDKIKGHCFECDLLHTAVCDVNTGMNEWLEHFKTFENYIKFFGFGPIVNKCDNNYIPINIVKSNISKGEYVLLDQGKRKRVIREIDDSEALRIIIDNVSRLIIKRSENIQKVLDM